MGIEILIEKVTETLKEVDGIEAIVLGGSRARGNFSAGSDIDIGLYYNKYEVDFSMLEQKAQALDQEHRENLLAWPGEWGKWMNGGCWLTIDNYPVDLILRDLDAVQAAVDESIKGIVTPHYQTGHPHAYFNTMYMGELAISKLLWYKNEAFLNLKTLCQKYPPEMKKTILHLFSFEMSFSLMLAKKNISRDDIYYVTAHIIRSISAINQVLFALNEQYCINEKQGVHMIGGFRVRPDYYKEKIDAIFSLISVDMTEACCCLKKLVDEVNELLNNNSETL